MDIALICAGTIAALGAITALTKAIARLLRLLRKLGHLADDLFGEPARDGVPARPGVMHRLHDIETNARDIAHRLDAIEAELRPNSGASLRDAVDRVEHHLDPTHPQHPPERNT
ncbi:hypothetical protein [Actinocrispum wychmicini]|uniref:Uncharacterized protein n=1 Tax=Actinocrispum wychmicini TaxID=1213861 RepID=A0A4R2KD15_9PSEU|nr:hypothetical protein [Actinocrispum wychmicini]TCO64395.1 hypothetical protein EV192_101163 [Actinocrispum wychmicini]